MLTNVQCSPWLDHGWIPRGGAYMVMYMTYSDVQYCTGRRFNMVMYMTYSDVLHRSALVSSTDRIIKAMHCL